MTWILYFYAYRWPTHVIGWKDICGVAYCPQSLVSIDCCSSGVAAYRPDMDMGQLFETQPNPTHNMLYTNPTQPISIYP